MSKYKITLTPVDKFFFGGDMTFCVGNDDNDYFNRQYSSYIIKSSMFPQQTSLLGMLRFLILRKAGEAVFKNNRIVDKKASISLIGSSGFKVTYDDGKRNAFGIIKNISHVRVLRDKTELEFAPLFEDIDFDKYTEGSYNFGKLKIPKLSREQYDAKDGLDRALTDGANRYDLSHVFVEDRRMGISRSLTSGKTDAGALFKQISYRFNDEEAKHCFVFYADVDNIDLTKYDGELVSVGGDNSQFIIGITKSEEPVYKSVPLMLNLLSPAFIKRDDVRKHTRFAVTQLMSFRFLTDRDDNKDGDDRTFHILNSKLKRSERYELYAPGSTFYFENDKEKQNFIEILESRMDFRQIGYNEYR